MDILYLHGSHTEGGGDTVYINQILSLLPGVGVCATLISIEKEKGGFSIVFKSSQNRAEHFFVSVAQVNTFIENTCRERNIAIIHIHTIYLPAVTRRCLKLLPVIKTCHATDMVCPGTYKFFYSSQQRCTIPFGAHCLIHAYTQRCCSRSPGKLISLYSNIFSEVNRFSKHYKSIVVMSEFVKQECISVGMDENRITVIPYFTPAANSPVDEMKDRRLLYVGRLSFIKGVHVMIESLIPVLNKYADLTVDIVGDGPYRKELENLVAQYGMSGKIVFHGWIKRDKIDSIFQRCFLLIFPSIYPEAFGISGIEAMMHAKPVIGFDVGGVSSWLKDNETGFLIPERNMHLLREKVELLLNDNILYKRMSENSRNAAVNKFTHEKHIPPLLKVYNDAIAGSNTALQNA